MENTPINRTPPRNLEAEQAVLGAVFLAKDAIVTAMEYVQPEDFYTRAHQIIFAAMLKLNDQDVPIDIVSMKNELDKEKQTANIGDCYLANCSCSRRRRMWPRMLSWSRIGRRPAVN